MRRVSPPLALCAAALLLGCSETPKQPSLADLDKEIAGDDVDPALTTALADQITVDPALTQQSNLLAVRPAPAPAQALYPPPGGERRMRTDGQPGARPSATAAAASASADAGQALCGAPFDYGNGWAERLPADLPLYPGAKLTEAAGNNAGKCRLRVAAFLTDAPPRQVLDWYADRARAAGYSADHQLRDGDHILAGTRGSDDAYFLVVTDRGGGSDVSLIANNGS